MPSSRGSSQPRNRTQVSCIADGFFLQSEPPGKPGPQSEVKTKQNSVCQNKSALPDSPLKYPGKGVTEGGCNCSTSIYETLL